jgi:hypothetical protein
MSKIKAFFQDHPLALGASVLSGALRVIQTLNFAPVGALSIYSGAPHEGHWRLDRSSPGHGDYRLDPGLFQVRLGTWTTATLFVYAALFINIGLGRLLSNTENVGLVVGTTVGASIQFFVTSNLGVWLTSGMYTLDLAGLAQCFTMAVPFYRNTFASDIVFTCVLFLAHHFLAQRVSPREAVTAQA